MVHSIAANDSSTPRYAPARVSGAEAIAALARRSGAGRIVAFENGAVSAVNDRILTISGTRLASEAGALASARSNARHGASLLQAAAAGLDAMAAMLDRMKELAETISPTAPSASADGGATSYLDRATLFSEFAALRSEIDAVAQSTEFDGVKILRGDGAGNAFQLTFRVGSGTADADGILIAIGPATIADLAAGLATDTLVTIAAAASAVTNVTAAIGQLGTIRGAVRGAGERISAAIDNGLGIAAGLGQARELRAGVDISVETVRVLGERIIDQGGVALGDVSTQLFRRVLLTGADQGRPDQGAGRTTSGGTGGDATSGASGGASGGGDQVRRSEPAE